MNNQFIKTIFSEIANNFNSNRFKDGDCLNLAVAVHEVLSEIGIKTDVIAIMRSDTIDEDEEEYDERLSHAAIHFSATGEEVANFIHSANDTTFDINGNNAYTNWSNKWNQIQIELGEIQEDFWVEKIDSDKLREYLKTAEENYGCKIENKLVDNLLLRNQIKEYVHEINLVKRYQLNKNNDHTESFEM